MCEYGALKDDLIRDRINIGIKDARASERLQLMSDLTQDKAVTLVRQAEIQSKQNKEFRSQNSEQTVEVYRIMDRKKIPNTNNDSRDGANNYQKKDTQHNNERCSRYGLAKHADSKKCPALQSTCRSCKKTGNWDRVCRLNKGVQCLREDSEFSEEEDEAYDAAFLGAVRRKHADKSDFATRFEVFDFREFVDFNIDTQADVTCVPFNKIAPEYLSKIQRPDKVIYGADGRRLSVAGFLNLKLKERNLTVKVKVYVVRGLDRSFLMKPAIHAFDLVKIVNVQYYKK